MGTVAPLQILSEENKNTNCMYSTIVTIEQGSQKVTCHIRAGEEEVETISIQNIQIHHVEVNTNTGDIPEKELTCRTICSQEHNVSNCLQCTTINTTEKPSPISNSDCHGQRVAPSCMSDVQETFHRNSDVEKNGNITKENRKIDTTNMPRKTYTCATSSDVENSAALSCHTHMMKT
ncbi:unnamed protein product [Mytilus edulis]|uniref:Uncharacterized protein n=1 Tax=Mytilus edulis TaxID=6550 RepID=A0A8S3T735_MYTED|nr:unnamed protein product [Mytilus edulis]